MARYHVDDLVGWKLGAKAVKEGSVVAKVIDRLGNSEGTIRVAFRDGIRFLVAKAVGFYLWKDKWLGERALSEACPRLFREAWNRDAKVSYYYEK